jgi:PAS domain S-box-containing protein
MLRLSSRLSVKITLGILALIVLLAAVTGYLVVRGFRMAQEAAVASSAAGLKSQAHTALHALAVSQARALAAQFDQASLTADEQFAQVQAELEQLKPAPGGHAFLVDGDGRLVAGSTGSLAALLGQTDGEMGLSDEALPRDLTAVADPLLRQSVNEMRRGQNGLNEIVLNNRIMLLAYAPVPEPGWSLALAAPVEAATAQSAAVAAAIRADARQTLQRILLTSVILIAVALTGAILFTRRLITRPLARLVKGAQAIEAGDLAVRIRITSQDEVGILADSFNQMTTELQALIAALPDIALVLDREGRCVKVAPTNAPLPPWPLADLPGRLLPDLLPSAAAAELPGLIEQVLQTRQLVQTEYCLPVDGQEMWLAVTISPMTQARVLWVARDITGRVQARQLLEQRVEERTHELSTLLRVSRSVSLTLNLERLLDQILDQLNGVISYSAASILERRGAWMQALVYRGPAPSAQAIRDRYVQKAAQAGSSVEAGFQTVYNLQILYQPDELIDARVINQQQAVIIPDVHGETQFAQMFQSRVTQDMRDIYRDVHSWLRVPLVAHDEVIGALTLMHPEVDYYTPRHAELARAFADQMAVALENVRLYEQARRLAALEERQKLARELHDSVSQALYGIALGTRTARTLLGRDPAQAVKPLDYIASLAEAGLAEMRALIFELRPESLQIEGLAAALAKQAEAARARHQLQVTTDFCPEPETSLAVKEALYRVAQEALHNVAKHAQATQVELRLAAENGRLTLTIRDDGQGFDPSGDFPGHLGLRSMRERLEAVGGEFHLHSAPGQGTMIRAVMGD